MECYGDGVEDVTELETLRARVAELERELATHDEDDGSIAAGMREVELDEHAKALASELDFVRAERDVAIKERDEARRCQALAMESFHAVRKRLGRWLAEQREIEELANKARPVRYTTLRDAITDAPNPEK